MRVTMIGSLPPFKGISQYTSALSQELARITGVEFISFKRLYPGWLYPDTLTDDTLKPPEAGNLDIRSILTWYNPLGWIWAGLSLKGDVVHAQWWTYVLTPIYATVLGVAKYLRRKPIILTIHNVNPHETGKVFAWLNHLVYRLADHYIVHTRSNKEILADQYKIDPRTIAVVPHGILNPADAKGLSRHQARQQLGVHPDVPVLLHFGIIREYKGLDVLLEALALVVKDVPETVLVIAGKPWTTVAGKSWAEWETYQSIIEKHGLEEHIHFFLDYIPENQIEQFFVASDVVVLPYKHFDSQSGVGSLALPFEKPMVVTDTGGLSELTRRPEALAEPDNSRDLARKLTRLLCDETLMRQLQADSAALARRLSWTTIARQTAAIYQRYISKVLFITRNFPPARGGMENVAFQLHRQLTKRNNVKLVKWGGGNRLTTTIVLPYLWARSIAAIFTFRPRAIYLQDGVLSPIGVLLKPFTKAPFAITIHGLDVTFSNLLYRLVAPKAISKMDRVICISRATQEQAISRGIPSRKTTVIPNGINDELYMRHRKTIRARASRQCGVKLTGRPVLLTVGRLVERKGIHWFVEYVLPELVAEFPDIMYVVSGEGRFRPEIEAAIRKAGMEAHVALLGRTSHQQLKLLYNAADVFVMPNVSVADDMEGFGIVVLEAASAELPVVATGIEGIAEAVRDGQTGLLVPLRDTGLFREYVARFLRQPDYARQFGAAARKYVLHEYSWSAIARAYERELAELSEVSVPVANTS